MTKLLQNVDIVEIIKKDRFKDTEIRRLCEKSKDLSELIKQLDSWFSLVPAHKAKDIRSRFINRDDKQHWGAFWELAIANYFNNCGYKVRWGKDNEPDIFIERNKHSFAIEIRGLYTSDIVNLHNIVLNNFIDEINEISFPVKLSVMVYSGFILDTDISSIKSEILSWLKKIKLLNLKIKYSKKIVGENYDLRVSTVPEQVADKEGIVFLHSIIMDNNRVEYAQSAISEKIKKARKYKDLLQLNDVPFIVALGNSSGFSIDETTMEWALFGKLQISSRLDPKTGNVQFDNSAKRDDSGLIAKSEYFRNPRNTRLSGAMLFNKQWSRQLYSFSCQVYENYWAATKISSYDFGCPTFKPISEGSDGVTFGWVNRDKR